MRLETNSIDFVIELLESIIFNIIITIVDLVSKIAYFILIYTTVRIKGVARLFLHLLSLTIDFNSLLSL